MAAQVDAPGFMARYPSAAGFVLDSHALGEPGGSGKGFDWSRWPGECSRPLLLAGGLVAENVGEAVRRLAPFDPVVWDRERGSTLFGFDYRLECYTPESKRVYGYFVLPILCCGELIGELI